MCLEPVMKKPQATRTTPSVRNVTCRARGKLYSHLDSTTNQVMLYGLGSVLPKHAVTLHAYCLKPNAIDLSITACDADLRAFVRELEAVLRDAARRGERST